MQRVCLLILRCALLLAASAVWARVPRLCSNQVPILKAPGQKKPSVTIRSVTMAPGRGSANIEIVNQSGKTITAFAYIVDISYTDGVHCKSERMTDWAGLVAAQEAGIQGGQGTIKPGEVYSEVYEFNDPNHVVDMTATMEVVVYSDQTAESINQYTLDRFIADRNDFAQAESLAAEAITAAMQDEHPLKSSHDRLLNMKHNDTATANTALLATKQDLEPGHGRNFASADEERKYLATELVQHRAFAATFAKHAKIVGQP